MATTQHYLWASGHFLLLVSALRCFFAWVTFKTVSVWWYKGKLIGSTSSFKFHWGSHQLCHRLPVSPLYHSLFERILILVTLLPYTIFSLFHALTFTRTTLMPQFLPPGPPSTAGGAPQPHPIAKRLQVWVKTNYDTAMKVVAYTELAIFVRIVLGAVTFRNSLLSPLIYGHFLRQRYYQSAFTREAFTATATYVSSFVQKQGNPTLSMVWDKTQMLIGRFAGSTLAPNPAGPAGGAGGAPRR
ncbi:hypothetical protein BDZ94DRAFT_1268265 [Collybia nuda]|uniref:Uncharacterized protein n=1 Tax=Collybia nuda TaxID=64659 RepID=A0A9P5Y171_9AGAR|nr:hypothetical protein BDZ94DRAFT_1268265 [Collybia nuda]